MKKIQNFLKDFKLTSIVLVSLFLSLPYAKGQTTVTYNFSGGVQTFTIPLGVTSLNITMAGASGATPTPSGGNGGEGGVVQGTLSVIPGTILNLYVGGAGVGNIGGFNGGGQPHWSNGGGGGGASDIRIGGVTLTNRVMVAGGGGGGGNDWFNNTLGLGGKGGATTGADGSGYLAAGKGGSQSSGGAGGTGDGITCYGGSNGTAGTLGAGGGSSHAGSGGGGFYGGGGGACHSNCWSGGGGGGSSWVSTSLVTSYSMSQGGNLGNGYISITIPALPTVITQLIGNLSATGVLLNGNVNDNGSSTNMNFEYSTSSTLSVGVVSISSVPSNINSGSGSTSVSATLNGLIPNSTYYYRLVGTNSIGSSNGNILNFTTLNQVPSFILGNSYNFQVCQNSNLIDITPHLHVTDIGNGQIETWSVAQFPNHGGQLNGFSTINSAIGGGVNISPSNSITYTPAIGYSGVEVFAIQVSDGIDSDTIFLNATILPSPSPSIILNGITLSTGNYTSYQWYLNGNLVIGANTSTLTAAINGVYTVKVIDTNGCSGTSLPLNLLSVGVRDFEIDKIIDIDVYPNPSNGHLKVKLNADIIPNSIEILNSLGNRINFICNEDKHGFYDLDLTENASTGIYCLKVLINDKVIVKPILIKQ